MAKLVVIDDEPNIRFGVAEVFRRGDVEVYGAETAEEGLHLVAQELPDVILLDIRLGNRSGLQVFHDLRELDPKCLVIFITGHGTADTAIEAMKLGAYDYLIKPLDPKQLQQIVQQAFVINRLMRAPAIVEEGDRPQYQPDRLIGSGAAMQAVCKKIGRVAPQNVNVLILGDSGTGKELVARAIYHHSRRSQMPFVAINCAAIPESLLESELFGYERGAFTGADRRRIGKFEQCSGGTLFLDEVGDMAAHTQAKVLRLIQEKRFERLGGNESIEADVRVIAATNQDLESLIESGLFRKDLYYRLRDVTIQLPPLCERPEDIAELAHYFLFRNNRQFGTGVHSISEEALALMEKHSWPGNVRELQSAIREALLVAVGPTIVPDFLPAEVHQPTSPEVETERLADSVPDADWLTLPKAIEAALDGAQTDLYRLAREQFDRLLLLRVMQFTHGNKYRAAEILGLSRATVRAKFLSMGIAMSEINPPGRDVKRD
jgi:two-component system, NtrC family, nitrogen regulation response regulator GlnG